MHGAHTHRGTGAVPLQNHVAGGAPTGVHTPRCSHRCTRRTHAQRCEQSADRSPLAHTLVRTPTCLCLSLSPHPPIWHSPSLTGWCVTQPTRTGKRPCHPLASPCQAPSRPVPCPTAKTLEGHQGGRRSRRQRAPLPTGQPLHWQSLSQGVVLELWVLPGA